MAVDAWIDFVVGCHFPCNWGVVLKFEWQPSHRSLQPSTGSLQASHHGIVASATSYLNLYFQALSLSQRVREPGFCLRDRNFSSQEFEKE